MFSLFVGSVFTLSVVTGSYPEVEPRKDPAPETPIADRYRADAERIIRATLADNDAWAKMEHLCLRIGHRLSGSKGLEEAIDWAVEVLKRDGLENVRKQKVMVPHWVRGQESATMLEPRVEPLVMLGLGGSVGTPPEGITAPVVVVKNLEELRALGEKAKGKMVLFNHAMPPYDPVRGSGYGEAVRYRVYGARWAAEYGAVAALVRSVTARSLRTPHTGSLGYGDAEVKIPAAAITIEDAETIAGLQRHGVPVVVNLKMEAKALPDAESANVIAELRGREKPEEIVVIGGHIDAWDTGHGAHDDAGGCVIAMEAVNVLRKLNMIPRRTIRVALWTNEENGVRGGRAYAEDHAHELANHVAAIESDMGVFKPTGYSVECSDDGRAARTVEQMNDMLSVFAATPIGPLNPRLGFSGVDIRPMKPAGVVLMGHHVEHANYFDIHHSPADTLDKVDPRELSENVAVLAVTAYIIADMPGRIGDPVSR